MERADFSFSTCFLAASSFLSPLGFLKEYVPLLPPLLSTLFVHAHKSHSDLSFLLAFLGNHTLHYKTLRPPSRLSTSSAERNDQQHAKRTVHMIPLLFDTHLPGSRVRSKRRESSQRVWLWETERGWGGARFREASMNIQGCKREYFGQDGVGKMCKVGVWKEMKRGGMAQGWKQGGGRRREERFNRAAWEL